jgi:hypothetical protein
MRSSSGSSFCSLRARQSQNRARQQFIQGRFLCCVAPSAVSQIRQRQPHHARQSPGHLRPQPEQAASGPHTLGQQWRTFCSLRAAAAARTGSVSAPHQASTLPSSDEHQQPLATPAGCRCGPTLVPSASACPGLLILFLFQKKQGLTLRFGRKGGGVESMVHACSVLRCAGTGGAGTDL